MSGTVTRSQSLRSIRVRALAPRALFYALVAILCLAGVRSILQSEPPRAAAAPQAAATNADLGAEAFAESFARVYLGWVSDRTEEREKALDPYLPGSLDASAGFSPAEGTLQEVFWTSAASSRHVGGRVLVTVAAQTTGGSVYLTVPVARDKRGFLYVAAYPAFVGPPPTTDQAATDVEEQVDDGGLVTVAERAVRNYLEGARDNLAADLTSDAVVSLLATPLHVTDTGDVVWIERGRRVAIEVDAKDERKNSWTLRYELGVEKRDRWYVRSLQADPTFEGGG